MAKKRKNNGKHANSKSPSSNLADGNAEGAKASNNKESSSSTPRKRPFEGFPLHLVPKKRPPQLSLKELYPSMPPVWVVPNFFTAEECQKWIDFCESSGGFEYTAHPATEYIAHRECFRMQEDNATELSRLLYRRLVQENPDMLAKIQRELSILPGFDSKYYHPVGFNPNIRLYKYIKGHSFGKHVDGSYHVPEFGNTEITVLVYLSACKGGATRFYSGRKKKQSSFAFDPEPGTVLLHAHGDHCLEHEAEEVLDGVKYVLRTDVIFASAK